MQPSGRLFTDGFHYQPLDHRFSNTKVMCFASSPILQLEALRLAGKPNSEDWGHLKQPHAQEQIGHFFNGLLPSRGFKLEIPERNRSRDALQPGTGLPGQRSRAKAASL